MWESIPGRGGSNAKALRQEQAQCIAMTSVGLEHSIPARAWEEARSQRVRTKLPHFILNLMGSYWRDLRR